MYAILGAADALGEPLVAPLGDPGYYRRFGFELSTAYQITPPRPEWQPHFQVRVLSGYQPRLRGMFTYPNPSTGPETRNAVRSATVALPSGRKSTVAAVARLIPATAWETRSCGRGCKGHRSYAWAWAATVSARHWVLTRRSQSDPSDLAFFYCHVPEGRPVSLPILIWLAGKRWPVEECLRQGKGRTGLDQHQVRLWHSFHRHTVLSMCA